MSNHKIEISDAKTLLSGAYERRRGYLTSAITTWNQVAILGTISIFGFLVKWEMFFDKSKIDTWTWELLAIEVGWAGAISSLLIGFWRYYAHAIDANIVRLYPAIYLSELAILPAEVGTVKPPMRINKGLSNPITRENLTTGFTFTTCQVKDFGGRLHDCLDIIAVLFIVIISLISMSLGCSVHMIYWLLIGNVIGLVCIYKGYQKFMNKEIQWPVSLASSS